MKNLISLKDFILEQEKEFDRANVGFKEFTNKVCNYTKFLNKPLTLGMFIPCAVDGEVLEKPDGFDFFLKNKYQSYDVGTGDKLDQYFKAKEKTLFVWQDGFDYKGICEMFTDLEDIIDFQFELTPLADKLLEAGI